MNDYQDNPFNYKIKSIFRLIRNNRKLHVLSNKLHKEYLSLSSDGKLEWYAELDYLVEKFNEIIKNRYTGIQGDSLYIRVDKYFINKASELLNKANEKYFKLIYPDSDSLADPQYISNLDKAYANIPHSRAV